MRLESERVVSSSLGRSLRRDSEALAKKCRAHAEEAGFDPDDIEYQTRSDIVTLIREATVMRGGDSAGSPRAGFNGCPCQHQFDGLFEPGAPALQIRSIAPMMNAAPWIG